MTGRYSEITRPKTIQEALEVGVPLVVAVQATGRKNMLAALEFEILQIALVVNVDPRLAIQKHQVPMIAATIFDNFKNETLQDFHLAFARGSSGLYGEIYRLDGAVLVRWIQLFLDEKYTVVEDLHLKEKGRDKLSEVNYRAFQERLEQERQKVEATKNAEIEANKTLAENVLAGRTPSGYTPQTAEQIAERKIHDLWIRNNHDKFGNKKAEWMDEDSWIAANEEMIKAELIRKVV